MRTTSLQTGGAEFPELLHRAEAQLANAKKTKTQKSERVRVQNSSVVANFDARTVLTDNKSASQTPDSVSTEEDVGEKVHHCRQKTEEVQEFPWRLTGR